MKSFQSFSLSLLLVTMFGAATFAQPAPKNQEPAIRTKLAELQQHVEGLKKTVRDTRLIADVEVYAKAVDWILRHEEFYQPAYADQALKALDTGLARAQQLAKGEKPWLLQTGISIRGYYSDIDGSVQPYAVALPEGIKPNAAQRWPLHVKLHGRAATMNEVNFISKYDGKPLPEGQTWVQIDVFGRTNNAYRWAGEMDVFEAIRDVKRNARIDDRRITLWGFSMGGAGAWHLGLHHPSMWSSVGAGAGFVDFYGYQKVEQALPDYQNLPLRIYDAVDYALNAFNVPVITYGGELDPQLAASTTMVERARKFDVPIKMLIGAGMGHKFDPDSLREFMAFHAEHSEQGRPGHPGIGEIRFVTFTTKYNRCEWATVEELAEMYKPAVVQGRVGSDGVLKIRTQNVAALQISRDVADKINIDGTELPLRSAADGLLPGVYFERDEEQWRGLDYDQSRSFSSNPDLRKRNNLQGPIDDAFMQPFVCVRGTGTPWSKEHTDWANWTLERFEKEFDKWMRGQIKVVTDKQLTDEQIADNNLILFGDPGSNALIARVLKDLPLRWTKETLEINGKEYDPATHGVSLIYPNPLNPSRYVVINSGHTFHDKDFKASNAWLFPRLGDVAVQKFARNEATGYDEAVVWAALFNNNWNFPSTNVSTEK